MSRWDKKCGGKDCPVKYRCERFAQRKNTDWWWLSKDLIQLTEKGCLYFLPRKKKTIATGPYISVDRKEAAKENWPAIERIRKCKPSST